MPVRCPDPAAPARGPRVPLGNWLGDRPRTRDCSFHHGVRLHSRHVKRMLVNRPAPGSICASEGTSCPDISGQEEGHLRLGMDLEPPKTTGVPSAGRVLKRRGRRPRGRACTARIGAPIDPPPGGSEPGHALAGGAPSSQRPPASGECPAPPRLSPRPGGRGPPRRSDHLRLLSCGAGGAAHRSEVFR